MDIKTVNIEPKLCILKRYEYNEDKFNRPQKGIITVYKFYSYVLEKYSGYVQEKVNSTTIQTYILLTPKVIDLKVGDIVEINSITYNVQVTHKLEEYSNEYEITVKSEV